MWAFEDEARQNVVKSLQPERLEGGRVEKVSRPKRWNR